MTDDARTLGTMLDEVVRSVPGVVALFAADPSLVRAARAALAPDAAVPMVAVALSDDAMTVVVNIGVDGTDQAPLTASSVASAVRAALPGRTVEVAVRVSRAVG